uniref:Uncharacterized protein n=1 Tax=Glossina brevipalpis TaxID=37001 RepID=A0A1A9WW50_9MUSC
MRGIGSLRALVKYQSENRQKELQETCYFNETIVHGYFVFRSVVDLQRRIGFTPRGKAVGPKKNVNDACYMFTKIPTDQFLHQHTHFFPLNSEATMTKPQIAQQSTMNSINIYEDVGLNIESSREADGEVSGNSKQEHLNQDNNRRFNGIENRHIDKKKQDHQDQTQDYIKNLNLSSVKNSNLGSIKPHDSINDYMKEQKQQRLHFPNPPHKKKHQVRHHHNDPHTLERRKHHEQKEKRKQRQHIKSSPTNFTTLSITTTKTTAMTLISTTPTLLKITLKKAASNYPKYSRVATTIGADISSTISSTTVNKRKSRRRKANKGRTNHTEQHSGSDIPNERNHLMVQLNKPIRNSVEALPAVNPRQSFNTSRKISQNPPNQKNVNITEEETQSASSTTYEMQQSTTESVSIWEKFPSPIATTTNEEVSLSSSMSPYFSDRPSTVNEDSLQDIANAAAVFNKSATSKMEEGSLKIYLSQKANFNHVILTTPKITTAQQLNKIDEESVTEANLLSLSKIVQSTISFTSNTLWVNVSLKTNASKGGQVSTKLQKSKPNDVSNLNTIPNDWDKLQENSSLVNISFEDKNDEPKLTIPNTTTAWNTVKENEHNQLLTFQVPQIENHIEKTENYLEMATNPFLSVFSRRNTIANQAIGYFHTTPFSSIDEDGRMDVKFENDTQEKNKILPLRISPITPKAVATTTTLKPELNLIMPTSPSPESPSKRKHNDNDSIRQTNNSLIKHMTNGNQVPLLSLSTVLTSPPTSLATLIINKSAKNCSQKLLATPFHQLTYIRNQAGEIDMDNIDNINVYPDLLEEHAGSITAFPRREDDNDSQLTLITAYLPTSGTATLPESIRIAKIKVNRERKRRLHLRSISFYT